MLKIRTIRKNSFLVVRSRKRLKSISLCKIIISIITCMCSTNVPLNCQDVQLIEKKKEEE